MSLPKDLLYTEEHEWVKADDGSYIIGITDFAQDQLGDIVFVELPEVGDTVTKGDSIGSIESVKTVSDFYAPVTGKVVAVNETLEDEPELINSNPYDTGWILKLTEVEEADVTALLSSDDYEKGLD
ncbi:glycine cleavage system protein GcvH [Listeria welshimeri]|uniref:Glycine cleavage system H protein n=1 Tax=Listeria welshimeri serovar 6b (strain ATCC 35897 / DSM 20650 / CCUG 15529 / CIP 8149 / NCTC 11857 / SLCC 5334 / V8) TaxID=386043 RepID=GCSH_LISW6|nr:glycine cleavage system protein GcvH [Listeria welshimeri]A0ALA8.1 RecName: Full=Glycine cleavage system H protein; AltName: Full=Octanoyl/lipoyl carrier protein [Listeria welshimeri serovar 6b str. SLCC5334]EGP9696767.1 glycine cleavage system protein GcvH [Listeria monocytogenes]MBC1249905.1 glycine cleavage system protein GcvH [Listeria welshimeri]MBC1253082.1 glycine cleavage system protein GcvH [Listeria welshimeri]MBC1283704.1 glycine cleavage system protein GcvH [Listeria welshimeri]